MPTAVRGGAEYFKGSHRMGDGPKKIADNFRASPFKDDLSNEFTFSQIHLIGQYRTFKPPLHKKVGKPPRYLE